jgi:purine-nucleoside phosphorylase
MSERAAEAGRTIQATGAVSPLVGIILGSGLGPVAGAVHLAARWSTADIPHFPPSTVPGHSGTLGLGHLAGVPVAVLSGRVHGYEGYHPAQVGFPVRVLHALGCRTLIVTNAAGALNPSFRPGDVVLITDHVSFPSLAGLSPLAGDEPPAGRPVFVDRSEAYSPALRDQARQTAQRAGVAIQQGVYVMVGGPNFETPAEVRFLQVAGGDLVGMSTVPEVIVARQLGMAVLGLSVVSNLAAGLPGALLTHNAVLETVGRAVPAVTAIIQGVVGGLGS